MDEEGPAAPVPTSFDGEPKPGGGLDVDCVALLVVLVKDLLRQSLGIGRRADCAVRSQAVGASAVSRSDAAGADHPLD
jgi:hypothetical protein